MWDNLRTSQIVEIKKALNDLINLIIGSNNLIKDLNFTSALNRELLSVQFALHSADFSNTIRIGKSLEQTYFDWIENFRTQLIHKI